MKTKKLKLNPLSNKLSSKTNFTSNFLFLLLIPIALVILSIVFYVVFGFNKSFDLKPLHTANIEFKSTIQASEFNEITDKISHCIYREGISSYELDVLNENNIQTKVTVKINSNISQSELSNLKATIEDFVIDDLGYSTASVTDFSTHNLLTKKIVSSICFMILFFAVVSFIYACIRIEIISALSIVVNLIISNSLIFAFILLFRIPISSTIGLAFMAGSILTTFASFAYFVKIKNLQYSDNFKGKLNREFISTTLEKRLAPIFNSLAILAIFAFIIAIVLLIIGNSFAFTLLAIVLAIASSFYSSTYIGTCIWNLFYKRSKNKRIKFYKDIQIKREEKKNSSKKSEDEKLIV